MCGRKCQNTSNKLPQADHSDPVHFHITFDKLKNFIQNIDVLLL